MLENSSNIKEQQQRKGTESLIPQKRSAGVIQVWAFKNNNALFCSRLVAPSRIVHLENTFMVRYLCPKIWVYSRRIRGWVVCSFTCFSLFHLWTICLPVFPILLFLDILLLHLQPIAVFSYLHPNSNSTKFLCFPQLVLGINSVDIFKQMNYSKKNSENVPSV